MALQRTVNINLYELVQLKLPCVNLEALMADLVLRACPSNNFCGVGSELWLMTFIQILEKW